MPLEAYCIGNRAGVVTTQARQIAAMFVGVHCHGVSGSVDRLLAYVTMLQPSSSVLQGTAHVRQQLNTCRDFSPLCWLLVETYLSLSCVRERSMSLGAADAVTATIVTRTAATMILLILPAVCLRLGKSDRYRSTSRSEE